MADRDLVALARAAALKAHAPYSRFHVGCAVESEDGEVALGSNMENASYPVGICAEASALAAAVQSFGLGKVSRIAIAGGRLSSEGALGGDQPCMPCGACRQNIAEAAQAAGRDIEVIVASGNGASVEAHPISALLPANFSVDDLA